MVQTTVAARADMVELPAGVTSMEGWGRNILLGKAQEARLDVLRVVRICSHRHTGSSQLQDLAKYILARRELGTLATSTGTVITAGGLVRHVKPPGH